MPFTLAQLEAFYWIARLGTFRGAARHLRLTQPTVSLRIRALERTLGTRLFARAGRGMRLTAEGTGILRQAERLLSLAGEIETRGGSGDARGVLRLGVPESFAVVCVPGFLERLSRDHPHLAVELTVEVTPELVGQLHERRLDVVVVGDPDPDQRLRAEPLGLHEMSWVASPRFALHGRAVRPIDLARYPVLSNPRPAPMFRIVTDWFRGAGLEPLHVRTCNSLIVMARLAVAGLGVAVLPPSLVRGELARGRLRVLRSRPPLPRVTMCATFHAEDWGPAIRAALDAMRRVVAKTGFLRPV